MAAFAPAIGAGIGMIGDLLGGFMGSSAAKQAAGLEAGVFGQNSNQLIGVGQQMMGQELGRLKPYIQGGQQGFQTLASLLKTPGQGLLQGYGSFQAPTGLNYQNDPGYQARLQLGTDAIDNSAAARGDLLSGNTLKALTDYGQTFGSNEYGNVYNRALQNYQTNAGNFYQTQANTFNRLSGLGAMGLQAGGMANNANQFYNQIYDQAMNMSNLGGLAAAGGIMGSSNAWQGALGGMLGNGMNLGSLLMPQGGGNQMSPFFGQMSPGQISGAYGGPTQAPIMGSPDSTPWQLPYNQTSYGG